MNRDFVDPWRAFADADVRFMVVGALEQAWSDRIRRPFGELEVDFPGRASFIRNKRATGRLKDLSDIDGMD